MNQFDVFETFGKKIIGMFRVNPNKTKLLLDDGSKLVFVASSDRKSGLEVEYIR